MCGFPVTASTHTCAHASLFLHSPISSTSSSTTDDRSSIVGTHVQVVLSLVLSDLLQNGQILLLDAVVFGLLPVHGLLLFHLVVVQIFDVLRVFPGRIVPLLMRRKTTTAAARREIIHFREEENATSPISSSSSSSDVTSSVPCCTRTHTRRQKKKRSD